MPDEVTADHSDILLRELLDRLQEADQTLKTDPHSAIKTELMLVVQLINVAAHRLAGNSVPQVVPGNALVRLLTAYDDLERGIVDPVLQPKPEDRRKGNYLHLMTRLLRVEPAVAMQLLINAGRRKDQAAQEVVGMLGENHPVFAGLDGDRSSIVARWRTEVMRGDDPDTKQKFDECLVDMAEILSARKGTAADLVRIARIMLREFDRYG